MTRFLFDTNALNSFLDTSFEASSLPSHVDCYLTDVQLSELKATRTPARRDDLLHYVKALQCDAPIGTAGLRSAPFGTAPFGLGPFGGGDGRYFAGIKYRLDTMPGNASRRGNTADALTLEACVYAQAALVTDDPSLSKVAQEFKVPTFTAARFVALFSIRAS
jgi:hypothetical protein